VKTIIRVAVAALLMAALAACEGGSLKGSINAIVKQGGTPAIASVKAGSGRVTVTWAEVPGASSYNLYWAQGATVTMTAGAKVANATSPQTVTGLTKGTQYAFIVTAISSSGESTASAVTLATTPQWWVVGSAGFTTGGLDGASLAIFNTTPYLAYSDKSDLNGRVTAMKFDGTNWVTIGTEHFTTGGAWGGLSFAISPSGVPYVAYGDSGNGYVATAKKFDGANWVDVGYPLVLSPGAVRINATSLAFSGATPYLAYLDESTTTYKPIVMRFGGTWNTVSPADFTTTAVGSTSLAILSSTPYVACGGSKYGGNKALVMMYDGLSWVDVGSEGFSGGEADSTCLATSNGTPFVAFEDFAHSQMATVMKYNGTNWVYVGSPGFSAGQAEPISFAVDRKSVV
jgi:hypothetical protein